MSARAVLIPVDGEPTVEEWEYLPSGSTTLPFLRRCVGGSVDHLRTAVDGCEAWVGDESLFTAPPNPRASIVTGYPGLHGPVVVTRYDDFGDTLGLTDEQIIELQARSDGAAS